MIDLVSPPSMAGKKRISTDSSLGIPPEVYGAFSAWCDRNSYIRKDVAGKLLRWFMEPQDDALRKVVIGGTSLGLEHAYAEALRKMAEAIDPSWPTLAVQIREPSSGSLEPDVEKTRQRKPQSPRPR